MRIAHNVTALNAWRQLNQISGKLGKSVERISSGYRINRAGDDPAGLVLSENLRAQIVGMDQALANTQDGVSMIQTAEGALTEIHSLLDSMRSLALHAANTAAITPEAIAADQEQLDSAIESIERIATTTAYAGKKLLDGSVGKKAEIKDTSIVGSVDVGKASAPGITYVEVVVTTAATKANLGLDEGHNLDGSATGALVGGETLGSAGVLTAGQSTTLNINGVKVTLTGGMTFSAAMIEINDRLTSAGIGIEAKFFVSGGTVASGLATISAAANSGYIGLVHTQWGSDYLIDLYDAKNLIVTTSDTYTKHARGTDVGGYFQYKRIDNSGTTYRRAEATGQNGLTLVGDATTVLNGLEITLLSGSNTAGTYTDVVRLYGDTTQFQIGGNAGETYAFTINSMRASELGVTAQATNGLNDLIGGNSLDLDSDPDAAIAAIDQAIEDVSSERAKLGALQVNVLESNERNLAVARENLTLSEARIRDVDMAKEMTDFTKNQILTQAATAMLAQANALPQAVLTLIR